MTLTDRQHQIARLVRLGYTNREIAECMGLSSHGVKMRVYEIAVKLDMRERNKKAQLAAWYVSENRK